MMDLKGSGRDHPENVLWLLEHSGTSPKLFGNEYFTNLTHGFMISRGTRNERVTEALSDLGSSVLSGGFTTVLAVAMLSFSSSDVFFTFFSVTATIVLLAEVVAFTLMMVLLAYIGPQPLENMVKATPATARDTTLSEIDVRGDDATTSATSAAVGQAQALATHKN